MSQTTTTPHLLLIGSTGKTGSLLLAEALSRSFTATALVRNTASFEDLINERIPTSQHEFITAVKGDPTAKADVEVALLSALSTAHSRGVVIISTLGQTRKSGSPWSAATSPPLFMTQAADALVAAISSVPFCKKSRVQKVVILSMFGAGNSFVNLNCLIKPVMQHSTMLQTVEDHNGVDRVIRSQSQVKWVMVRPSMFKTGGPKPVIVREENGAGEGWMPSSTTTGSVVDFLLSCVGNNDWDWKAPVIAN